MNIICWGRKTLIHQFLQFSGLNNNNKLVNKNSCLYSTGPPRSYSSPKPTRKSYHHFTSRQSTQNLLKSFYSSRLSVSPSQLQTFVIQISKNSDLKVKDHRWQSLYMTIEKYQDDFSLQSKIYIMQALGRVRQNNSLYIALYKNVLANFQHLDLNQLAILIWSMVKVQQHDKATVLAIYKRFYEVLQNQSKSIKLITGRQQITKEQANLRHINEEDEQQNLQKQYIMSEGNFTLLIWALQRNALIDQKLILALFKNVFTDQTCQNLHNVRIQNLCLIMYCMCQLGFQKYRIAQLIANRIMKLWQEVQKINVLTTVLLIDSFSIFITGKQKYLFKYAKDLEKQKVTLKEQSIKKERKFVLFLVEATFLKRQKFSKTQNSNGKPDNANPVIYPLSTKFSSQILHNLGKICLYQKQIWLRLLSYICDVVDQAQVIDLSMALSAICMVQKSLSKDERNQLFPSKSIISKRLFQLYTSLDAKTIYNLKDLIHNKLIQNQLVPVRIRKQVELQFSKLKIQEQNKKQAENQQHNQQQNEQKYQPKNQQRNSQKYQNKNQNKYQQKKQEKFVRKQHKDRPQKSSRPQKQHKNEFQE